MGISPTATCYMNTNQCTCGSLTSMCYNVSWAVADEICKSYDAYGNYCGYIRSGGCCPY